MIPLDSWRLRVLESLCGSDYFIGVPERVSIMTRSTSFALSVATIAMFLGCLAGSASSATPPQQCQSKWVAAGNNGAKADRYYRPNCQ
jgi:hypothetical protein